jgi:hypothetical protein
VKIVAIHEFHAASEHRNNQMDSNVPAEIDRSVRVGSLSGLLVILVALGITFIGVREYLNPAIGAVGFGVPLHDPLDANLLAVKAVRDVVSGILALTFLGLRNRKFLACAFQRADLDPRTRWPGRSSTCWLELHTRAAYSLGNSRFHAGDRRIA